MADLRLPFPEHNKETKDKDGKKAEEKADKGKDEGGKGSRK